ncbi:hypothetical protein NET02_14360 [Thermomicrobiaceae bacterium CFH 74404]|uniref:Uncharacterized protein n=1 Tax=Thermalbibacter longus TaxID=2951981 RepID=A0AA42BE22_9BACT|nr:hypothetical protein [Thermalbibacter longus]MCM8750333.1 hypothetical protein [Thermalbibacter longus]
MRAIVTLLVASAVLAVVVIGSAPIRLAAAPPDWVTPGPPPWAGGELRERANQEAPQTDTTSSTETLGCEPIEQSAEEVLPGVVLTWDSAFLCADAPDAGSYELTVTVSNSAESAEAVSIDALTLTHTTPRPRGQAPSASGDATGLPLTLAPGTTASFTVSGTYELVETDEGKKANLHFRASGHGLSSGEPFELGINAHVRAPGVPLD